MVLRLGLFLFSFVSKHNTCSSYDWIYCCCRSSVNTRCGRIMIGLSLSFVSEQNIWLVLLWLGCRFRLSVNIECGRIMIGFIVVFVRQ